MEPSVCQARAVHAIHTPSYRTAIAAVFVLSALLGLAPLPPGVAGAQQLGQQLGVRQTTHSAAAITATPQKVARAVIAIKGMYCESCEKTIHAMLMRTPGVESASVSAKSAQAVVVYDASRTQPSVLLATIKSLGYSASLKPDNAKTS